MSEEYVFDDDGMGGDDDEPMGSTDYAYTGGTEDDDGFEGMQPQPSAELIVRPTKKARPVILTSEDIAQRVSAQVDNVVEVLAWSRTSALLMLRHCKWSSDIVKERYFDDPERLMAEAKVTDLDDKFAVSDVSVTCSMCWDDVVGGKAAHLACGHPFCVECWADHLRHKLKTASTGAIAVSCPQDACPQYCGQQSFERVFGRPSKELDKYIDFINMSFIDGNDKYGSCPAPGCTLFVEYPVKKNLIMDPSAPVECDCGFIYCFKCGLEDHSPASCNTIAEWKKKEGDDEGNSLWLCAHTKPCPKCSAAIEKASGCARMVCGKCSYEFCWVCEKKWSSVGGYDSGSHKCNIYEPEKDTTKREGDVERDAARAALERYGHYFTRFMNHRQSRKFDQRTMDSLIGGIQSQVAKSQRVVIDLDYLKNTARVLFRCRHVLQYSYAYAYYLPVDSVSKELFEANQAHLEHWTELLSAYIEDCESGKYTKQEVVNRTNTAEQMLRNLMEGCVAI